MPDKKGNLLFLGFDRARWERRKAEARARWEKERVYPAQTVTTFEAIEKTNAAYWREEQFSPLRKKYMQETVEARKKLGSGDEIEKILREQLQGDETE